MKDTKNATPAVILLIAVISALTVSLHYATAQVAPAPTYLQSLTSIPTRNLAYGNVGGVLPTIGNGGGTGPVVLPGSTDVSGALATGTTLNGVTGEVTLDFTTPYNSTPTWVLVVGQGAGVSFTTSTLTMGTSYFTLTGDLLASTTYTYQVIPKPGQ